MGLTSQSPLTLLLQSVTTPQKSTKTRFQRGNGLNLVSLCTLRLLPSLLHHVSSQSDLRLMVKSQWLPDPSIICIPLHLRKLVWKWHLACVSSLNIKI